MTDTKHTPPPVEGDGISYRGIVWFAVILTLVTVTCQVLIWVLLKAMQHQTPDASRQASPMAKTVDSRLGREGQVYPDMVSVASAPADRGPQMDDKGMIGPTRLLVQEPVNLEKFHARENDLLTTYGVVDQATGAYRIPIDKAKDLVVARGLPVRGKQ
jgi:hypothetical protein